jgi:hypothetical protein
MVRVKLQDKAITGVKGSGKVELSTTQMLVMPSSESFEL